ncbi:hypothetical protein GOBAR_AA10564 [Gossypium barbadense]|uniref:Uncharacterized protein n=1 Tax=Gossypium barbadense TaxID=3634 RepID=A0A2P5Y3C4_GOSBA|nr:hypothetical protein GOBAR_AA10564 [Gossypium barbadense]
MATLTLSPSTVPTRHLHEQLSERGIGAIVLDQNGDDSFHHSSLFLNDFLGFYNDTIPAASAPPSSTSPSSTFRHQPFSLLLCCRRLPTRSQVLLCRGSRRLQEQLSSNGAVLDRDFGSGSIVIGLMTAGLMMVMVLIKRLYPVHLSLRDFVPSCLQMMGCRRIRESVGAKVEGQIFGQLRASIKLLKRQQLDFKKNKEKGVDFKDFAKKLWDYGLVFNCYGLKSITWITFHGTYNFEFMLKITIQSLLPWDLHSFVHQLAYFFGYNIFNLKHTFKLLGLLSGLEKIAQTLNMAHIVGSSHQAGSDNLLTHQCFIKLKDVLSFFPYDLFGILKLHYDGFKVSNLSNKTVMKLLKAAESAEETGDNLCLKQLNVMFAGVELLYGHVFLFPTL